MLPRRASETESTQAQQQRLERASAPPGQNYLTSLPDPGEWNGPNDAAESRQQQQEEAYYDQEEGQCNDQHQHQCHDGGDDGQCYQDDEDGQYQCEDDAEYQQEQQQYDYMYDDEDALPHEEDIPAPEPKQQRGVRFRSILKQEKSSSDNTNNKKGRKQISAYNLFGLSRVSAAYDSGNKGYLTTAEQKLREMDKANIGSLNNAQVAQLMEQKLRED